MPKGVHLKQLFTGVAMAALVPLSTSAIAGPSESGMSAGGAWAKDFDPGKSFQSATSALGLKDTKTSGELGGEVGLQVKQQQQRNFRCRDGARLTAGGIRVNIEECQQSDDGDLQRLRVAVCDALTQGIRCSDDRYTQTREVPLGGEAAFSGGDLYGAYRVEAECAGASCVMTMHQLHGDAWGGNNMRQQGNDRVDQDPNHPSNTIADVRDNPTFDQGSQYAEDRSKCLGGQINQLFSEGDIPVSCDPEDPRTIDFLDIDGGGQCEPDRITTETCTVDIPTRLVTCEPESKTCDVQRETAQFTCERKLQVQQVGSEACTPGQVVYQWRPYSHLYRRFVCQACHHPFNCLVYQFNQNGDGWRSSFRFEYSRVLGWHHPELMPGAPSGYYIRQTCSNGRCTIHYRRNPSDSTKKYNYDEAAPIFQDTVTENCDAFEQRRPETN